MNSILAGFDNLCYLVNTNLRRVFRFQCGARDKSTVMNSEYDCLHQRIIGFVKWTIDKYVYVVIYGSQGYCEPNYLALFILMALTADLAALRLTLPVFAELLTVRNAFAAADFAALEARGSRRVLPAADTAAAEASRLGELR